MNPRPPESQSGALPTELRPPLNRNKNFVYEIKLAITATTTYNVSHIGDMPTREEDPNSINPFRTRRCSV